MGLYVRQLFLTDMKPKHILTDVDGVLLNWNKAFVAFMTEHGYPQVPDTDHEYNLDIRHGLPLADVLEYVNRFNTSESMTRLEPLVDSVKYVKILSEQGFRFTAITSLSDHPSAFTHRSQNLKNVFGDVFDEVVCLRAGAHKDDVLKRWIGSGLFWIEDHQRQALAGYEAGLQPILIKHAYNSHFNTDLFPSVNLENAWEEIYRIVAREYNLA